MIVKSETSLLGTLVPRYHVWITFEKQSYFYIYFLCLIRGSGRKSKVRQTGKVDRHDKPENKNKRQRKHNIHKKTKNEHKPISNAAGVLQPFFPHASLSGGKYEHMPIFPPGKIGIFQIFPRSQQGEKLDHCQFSPYER